MLAEPEHDELQVGEDVPTVNVSPPVLLMAAVKLAGQPLESVTVTLTIPAQSTLAVELVGVLTGTPEAHANV
jgi:hypothetical protein